VRLFGLGNGTFDSDMIDLCIIVSPLPLGVKIGVGASSNCEDCAMGGNVSDCGGDSWICGWSGGGGLASVLT
jgi:hypothetical protein